MTDSKYLPIEYNPRDEFYARFGSAFEMRESQYWNTYHRSLKKRLNGVKQYEYTFFAESADTVKTQADKRGTYQNPMHFEKYRAAVVPVARRRTYETELYDASLIYRHALAAHMAARIKVLAPKVKANADNHYPCLLMSVPKPEVRIKDCDWTHFTSVFVMAMTLKLASERGLNMETVRRASFGHARPTFAECSPSLRFNVGIIPRVYADIVVEAIVATSKLLAEDVNRVHLKAPILVPKLKQDFDAYRKKHPKAKTELAENLWDALWSPADSQNHSFVYQWTRKEINIEWLINKIYEALLKIDKPLDEIVVNKGYISRSFVVPILDLLKCLKLSSDNKMTLDVGVAHLPEYTWPKPPAKIDDPAFWQMVKRSLHALDAPKLIIDQALKHATLDKLYTVFDKYGALACFKPDKNKSECQDGAGSDSEAEGELDDEAKLYAKKFITATAMRAIQLCHAAVRNELGKDAEEKTYYLPYKLGDMYYETEEALKHFALKGEAKKDKAKTKAEVLPALSFFDINHCNTKHGPSKGRETLIHEHARMAVIDTTSATQYDTAQAIKDLFKAKPNLDIVLTVSSGLKNEQAGSDMNPYGTIRIFAKSRNQVNHMRQQFQKLESDVDYAHPAKSHAARRSAKARGLTPTNTGILKQL